MITWEEEGGKGANRNWFSHGKGWGEEYRGKDLGHRWWVFHNKYLMLNG